MHQPPSRSDSRSDSHSDSHSRSHSAKPRHLLAGTASAVIAIALACASGLAQAQISNDAVRIGFITDMSGPYADTDGTGGLEAIRMAVADFGGKVLGKPIEIMSADHQNKADIAATRAREWADERGLDMLIGGVNSATALSMNKVMAEKKRVYINIGAGTARLTNEECTPYTVHYEYDTVALAKGTGTAVIKQGGRSWYFLVADYAFGHSLANDTSAVVKANGGTVVGSVRHPPFSSDLSSFMLQAQASKAQILGLANAGEDTVNSIKAAKEFGVTKNMKLVGLLMVINDIHALGLANAEGLMMTDSWYWDKDDASRKFAERFYQKMKKMPSTHQAAAWSATTTYLKAVAAAGTDDSTKVMAELKKTRIDDFYNKGYIRADGRNIHDMYLYQVKSPAESKKPWDYLKLLETIPGEQAFTTVAESKCSLLKQ